MTPRIFASKIWARYVSMGVIQHQAHPWNAGYIITRVIRWAVGRAGIERLGTRSS